MSQNLQLIPLQPLGSNQLQVQNMIKSIQDLDTDEIKKAFQLTKQSYKRTRTAIYPPFPIPAKDCIPTMASIEQTKFYEAQFISVLRGHLDNQTIGDLLKIYSFSDEQIPIGKINFVGSFLQKITAKNIVSCSLYILVGLPLISLLLLESGCCHSLPRPRIAEPPCSNLTNDWHEL